MSLHHFEIARGGTFRLPFSWQAPFDPTGVTVDIGLTRGDSESLLALTKTGNNTDGYVFSLTTTQTNFVGDGKVRATITLADGQVLIVDLASYSTVAALEAEVG